MYISKKKKLVIAAVVVLIIVVGVVLATKKEAPPEEPKTAEEILESAMNFKYAEFEASFKGENIAGAFSGKRDEDTVCYDGNYVTNITEAHKIKVWTQTEQDRRTTYTQSNNSWTYTTGKELPPMFYMPQITNAFLTENEAYYNISGTTAYKDVLDFTGCGLFSPELAQINASSTVQFTASFSKETQMPGKITFEITHPTGKRVFFYEIAFLVFSDKHTLVVPPNVLEVSKTEAPQKTLAEFKNKDLVFLNKEEYVHLEALSSDWTDGELMCGEQFFKLGMPLNLFMNKWLFCKEENKSEYSNVAPGQKVENLMFIYPNDPIDTNIVCYVDVKNISDEEIMLSDCRIVGLRIYAEEYTKEYPNIFYCGVDLGGTLSDISSFGDPFTKTEKDANGYSYYDFVSGSLRLSVTHKVGEGIVDFELYEK